MEVPERILLSLCGCQREVAPLYEETASVLVPGLSTRTSYPTRNFSEDLSEKLDSEINKKGIL